HMLTFPGLFAPTGLLGAGPQSTAWMYMFWHAGFPACVIAYGLLAARSPETSEPRGRASGPMLCAVGGALVSVSAFTFLATAGQDWLPAIMLGNHYTSVMIGVVSSVWGLSLLALITLWRGRPYSVLDLWLMVVMCA